MPENQIQRNRTAAEICGSPAVLSSARRRGGRFFSAVGGDCRAARDNGHRQPRLQSCPPQTEEYVSPERRPTGKRTGGPAGRCERRPAGWLRASRRLKDRLTDTKRRQVDGGIRTEAGSGETPGPDPDGREEAAPRRSCGIKERGPGGQWQNLRGPFEGIGQESFQNRTLADGVGDATDPVDLAGDHISALEEAGGSIPIPTRRGCR